MVTTAPPRHLPAPARRAAPARRLAAPALEGVYGTDPGPHAVAHRGGAGLAPENTLRAFETSLALGLTYLETDVRTTADGVPLAFHDPTLDRVTDLRGPVAEHPWESVRRARVLGSEPVPALEDLLGSFPSARFMIDVKDERSVRPTIEAVRRTGTAARVCVAGGWDPWLAAVRDGCGTRLTTALGWRALSTLIGCAQAGVRPPASVATGAYAHVTRRLGGVRLMARPRFAERLLTMAHDLGVRVVTWTINDVPEMHRLFDQGADGVITDRPDLLRAVVLERSGATGTGTVLIERTGATGTRAAPGRTELLAAASAALPGRAGTLRDAAPPAGPASAARARVAGWARAAADGAPAPAGAPARPR